MIMNLVAIFIGGGTGAVLRYITSVLFSKLNLSHFPFATLVVNILGCFVIGLIFAYCLHRTNYNPTLKLALTVGFCGGLTTFSTFSLEIVEMLKTGNYFSAFSYILISFLICIIAVFWGIKTIEYFF